MTATLLPNAKQQFLDSNGRPLAGGQVYFYIPNTSTFKNTWQDAGETVLNTNPVVLDANGQAIIYGNGQYRQVVYDVHGNLIWDKVTSSPITADDISSTTDATNGAGAVGFNYSLSYAAGTIGKWLKDLANSAGSSFIGFLQAGVGAVLRTVQDKLRDRVSVKDFGAKGDGTTDDTNACNAAITYAAANGKSVYFPPGVYLLGTLTYIDPVPANPGARIWGLLFAKSNVCLFGDGETSVLKAADGLVASNSSQQGTKGYQIIVHSDPNVAVNNFSVQNLGFDGNGANNLVPPVNSYGNQAACHGVMIENGDRISVKNCYFKNFPGHQVVALSYSTARTTVSHNEFRDCGWLNGTNTNLTDHSTIYIGSTDFVVADNVFTQSSQMLYGTAIECHGTGKALNNVARYYGSVGISSALVVNGDHVFAGNTGDQILCGFSQYCGGGFTLTSKFVGNAIDLSFSAVPNTSSVYKLRNAIYSGQNNIGNSPGTIRTIVRGNTFRMVGTRGWSTDAEDLYNSFMVSQLITELTIVDNHVQGFRGPLLQLDRQASSSTVMIGYNAIKSCGRKDDYVDNNGLVNYSNGADSSYGVTLFSLTFTNNSFTDCFYANYMSLTSVAAGSIVCPGSVYVNGDVHNRYLSLFSQTGTNDIPTPTNYRFNFTVNNTPDTTKPFPSTTYASRSACGVIRVEYPPGNQASFTNILNSSIWNFQGQLFSASAPTSARPFGDNNGDTYTVLRAAAGGYSGYYCTVSGVSGAVGTWKGYGSIAP